ncbi:MAG: hypothetical protein LRY41_00225 [Candidatus Pacebacteria bacterium]|nr:hypothetical protein [Candidatus Paceibacterota bacterium]MCD8508385.1 hypothetical protein [Candidatus Paceibacterota bacterium]MCD8527761.1 hypothetical protein [Candidatus Paceibacterota bacterium]MCD8563700.1 hypothetical protein [Candidatus Paceibacterota bacterium]
MEIRPLIIYKYAGETLALFLERVRRELPHLAHEKITYAGRLDPMAEGVMILLVGDDVHAKEDFLGLDKVYHIDVLLGVQTDTGDILGIISDHQTVTDVDSGTLPALTAQLEGKRRQIYPLYSSRTVGGVPLWKHARDGVAIDTPPDHAIEIMSIQPRGVRTCGGDDLVRAATQRIRRVKGDFRQDECAASWSQYIHSEHMYTIISFEVHTSSGAYMRVLAEEIGKLVHVPACAWRIKRVQVGEYKGM